MSEASQLFEVEVRGAGKEPRRLRVGARPVYVGRAPICDLVFQDPAISNRHLSLWVSGGELFAEDLRSRNGTLLNDARMEGVVRVPVGGVLRVGADIALESLGPVGGQDSLPRALIEDLDAGVRYGIAADRLIIGASEDADVSLPEATGVRAVVLLHLNGEARLGVDGDDQPLEPDETFTVAGRRFCLRMPSPDRASTQDLDQTSYPYELRATLDGPTGAVATITDLRAGKVITVSAPNRATLLYLLASRCVADAAMVPALRGWCADEEIIAGIWGRLEPANPHNSLNVLVMRTRRELEKAGVDPWFIEKRMGHLRARVERALID